MDPTDPAARHRDDFVIVLPGGAEGWFVLLNNGGGFEPLTYVPLLSQRVAMRQWPGTAGPIRSTWFYNSGDARSQVDVLDVDGDGSTPNST